MRLKSRNEDVMEEFKMLLRIFSERLDKSEDENELLNSIVNIKLASQKTLNDLWQCGGLDNPA